MKIDIIEELKRIFQCKSDYSLAKTLEIGRSQVNRWRKNGFSDSTERILIKIINKYREIETPQKKVYKT